MLIECTIRRKAGTTVTLDGTTYHFKPDAKNPGGPHLCDVANKEHRKRLLAVPESYEVYDPQGDAKAKTDAANTGASSDGGQQNAGEQTDDGKGGQQGDNDGSGDDLDGLGDADLRALYADKTGRTAHPNMKRETLLARLRGDDADGDE